MSGGVKKSEGFSSRWGLILAAMGAAVGTGNIWRFPREAATNGGGSFLIPWLIFLFVWSIPLLMAEYAIGKRTRLASVGSFRRLAGKKYTWMGMWMVWVSVAISFYYAVVMGWTIKYITVAFTLNESDHGDAALTDELFHDFIHSPAQVVFFQLLAVTISMIVIYRGVKGGIELVNKILMPLLIGFLAVAAIYPFFIDNPNPDSSSSAVDGLKYMLLPQSDYLFRPETWLHAMVQSAWSCSAGFGTMLTYAVYMRKKEDVALNSFLTGLGNNSISLVAGIAVLGTVFSMSQSVNAGETAVQSGSSGLTFIHLTTLFAQMEGGKFIALLFFLGMSFAALTSMIGSIEAAARNMEDMGWERKHTMKYIFLATFALGVPSALSIEFLDNQDFVWGAGLLVSGLFTSFAVMKFGHSDIGHLKNFWGNIDRFRENLINTEYSDIHIDRWWNVLIVLIPIEFLIVFVWFVGQQLTEGGQGTIDVISMVFMWGVAFFIFHRYNDWAAARIDDNTPPDPGLKDGQYDENYNADEGVYYEDEDDEDEEDDEVNGGSADYIDADHVPG